MSGAPTRLGQLVARGEAALAVAVLGAMTLLPLANAVSRWLGAGGLPTSIAWAQHLTLVVTFLGAAIAASRREHLSLAAANELLPTAARRVAGVVAAAVGATVTGVLCWAAIRFVIAESESTQTLAFGVPIWVVELCIPVGLALVAARLACGTRPRAAALGGTAAGLALVALVGFGDLAPPGFFLLALLALVVATVAGTPLFVTIGGLALLLFWSQGTPAPAVVVETYRLVSSPSLPAIPLFTLAGFFLARGGAARRLVELFTAAFGWAPGGVAIAAALACAFFTTFTGASGVTILALGGLLLPALVDSGHGERFSLGLVTASGSLGLLLFPSLPVILYAVVAEVDILQMFAGAALPGLLVIASVALLGLRHGQRHAATRTPFSAARLRSALWQAKWELGLPALVLVGFLSGLCTFVECAALAAAWALVVEVFVHRDLPLRAGAGDAVVASASLVGAVLIILGVALGLTSFLIDAEVPAAAIAWTEAHLESRLAFLLALNVILLLVGCLMDTYSAIAVFAPLLAPVGVAFGVDPIHLGVIFLVNLELGFLTPPIGMNLFISSMRFAKPLGEVLRSIVPFFVARVAVVLLVTYLPWLTTVVAGWVAPP